MTKSAPLDIDQWLQEQFDSLEYAEHMDDGVDKRRLLMFRWRYDQARDEITRLRRLSLERDEMVERCAKVAETFKSYTGYGTDDAYARGNVNAAKSIAMVIRSLSKPQEGGER